MKKFVLLFYFVSLSSAVSALEYEDAIKKIIANSGKVSIAIVVSDVRLPEAGESKFLRKAVEDDVLNSTYKGLLNNFSEDSRFRLLDRQTVDVVMAEYVFQAKGFTRQIDASKIGSFTNATHLLILSLSHKSGNEFDVLSKLVAVDEARILSAERFSVFVGGDQIPPSSVTLKAIQNDSVASTNPRATKIDWAAKQKETKIEEVQYLFYSMEAKEKGETPITFDKWLQQKRPKISSGTEGVVK